MNMQPQRAPAQPLLCWRKGVFHISTDRQLLDIDAIQRFLSLPDRAAAERLARHGLCFGLYRKRHQLSFARMVTDYATFASVSELFVSAEYRGVGLGSWLTRCCLAHPALRGLRVTLPALQAPWRADGAAHAPRALH